MLVRLFLPLCCASVALCGVTFRRPGWLDRAVGYHRQHFVNDVLDVAPIRIKASLQRLPAGYTDPPWDYASVARLLALLGASDTDSSLRVALRRALRLTPPSRRFYSEQESWKLFPSLGKDHPNEIYYDFSSGSQERAPVEGTHWDGANGVVVLHNPVEARLPGAQISIKLLREILEARALAGRKMPSTASSTIAWITKNMTSADAVEANNVTNTDQSEGTSGYATTNTESSDVTAGAAGEITNVSGDAHGDITTTTDGGGETTSTSENSARAFLSSVEKRPYSPDYMENSQI